MLKTKTIKKVKVYDGKKLIAYYKNREGSNKYKVFSKGIVFDLYLGVVDSDAKAIKLIEKHFNYIHNEYNL